MRYLGATFEQAATLFGWGALVKFSRHLPLDSAVYRYCNSELANYASNLKTNVILADVVDSLTGLIYMLSKISGGKPQKPEPYPRPWKTGNQQVIGSDPIPISEFDAWYYGGD